MQDVRGELMKVEVAVALGVRVLATRPSVQQGPHPLANKRSVDEPCLKKKTWGGRSVQRGTSFGFGVGRALTHGVFWGGHEGAGDVLARQASEGTHLRVAGRQGL